MKTIYLILFTLGLAFLGGCLSEETETVPFVEKTQKAIDSTKIQYLLFAKEGIVEIWTAIDTLSPTLVEKVNIGHSIDFPIGIYKWSRKDQGLILSYPNAFYQEKLGKEATPQQLSFAQWTEKHPQLVKWQNGSDRRQVLVLPNDFRTTGRWDACFACPHWMAEVYGALKARMSRF